MGSTRGAPAGGCRSLRWSACWESWGLMSLPCAPPSPGWSGGGCWWPIGQAWAQAVISRAMGRPARRAASRPREACADYGRVLTDWRRLPYSDPGLPAELLPPGWTGARAAEIFFTLQSRLAGAAGEHAARATGEEPAGGSFAA